ncbi:MAG: cyclic nucleotide-binding domain-containing protein [Hyphomicrobiales bacterium]
MSLPDDIDRLRRVSFLSVLDDECLRLIAFNAEHESLSDAQTVFFDGEQALGALLITGGSLSQMELVNGELKERRRLKAGSIVDPYALISDIRRSFTAKAVGDLSYMLLDRPTFMKAMTNYPDLAQRVQDYLSDDITRVASSLSNVASRLDYIN